MHSPPSPDLPTGNTSRGLYGHGELRRLFPASVLTDETKARGPLRPLLRWLSIAPAVMLLTLCSGQLALSRPIAITNADTRSKLPVDYSPWTYLIVRPIRPDIVSEIQIDYQRFPEVFGSAPGLSTQQGRLWQTPVPSPSPLPTQGTATPSAIPTGLSPTPTLAPAVTATATVTPTLTLSPTATRSPSASPTPTSIPNPDCDWYSPSWPFRLKLTFDNTAQADNLMEFPVLVTLNSGRVDYSQIQNAGQDLRFVDADGETVLPHEIEAWNESGDSYVWVKIPQIDGPSASDYIWLYYGNPSAPDGQDVANVWDGQFRGVWHLNETSGLAGDSTSFGTSGAVSGGTTQGVAGRIDGAYEFNGGDGTVNMGDPVDGHLDFGTGSFTYEAWINIDQDTGTYQIVVDKGGSNAFTPGYELNTNENARYFYGAVGDGSSDVLAGSVTISLHTWYYFAAVVDRGGDELRVFRDGALQSYIGDLGGLAGVDSGSAFRLSRADFPVDGWVDEVRVSSAVRSAGWIRAQHQAMTDNFISHGAVETSSCVP